MDSVFSFISLALTAILVENFVLVKFLGVCPFVSSNTKPSSAAAMGTSVLLVMTAASAGCALLNNYVLVPFGLQYLRIVAFLIIILVIVTLFDMLLRLSMHRLYSLMGRNFSMLLTNCAILGVVLINTSSQSGILMSTLYGLLAGTGFMIAMVLYSLIAERLQFADIPAAFQGLPVAMISAALLALSFMGFTGLRI